MSTYTFTRAVVALGLVVLLALCGHHLIAEQDLEASYSAALDEMAARHYDGAAAAFRDIVTRFGDSPRRADALLGELRALGLAGHHQQVVDLALALSDSPELSERAHEAIFLGLDSLEALGEAPRAAALWQSEAHRLDSAEYRGRLATHYSKLGDRAYEPPPGDGLAPPPAPNYSLALDAFLKARALSADASGDLDRKIASCHEHQGDQESALAVWDRLAQSPQLPLAATGLYRGALVRSARGPVLASRQQLRQLRQERFLDTPESPLALIALEESYGDPGERPAEGFAGSIAALVEFVRAYPDHPRAAEVARRLADRHAARGDLAAAIAAWRHFLERHAAHADAPEVLFRLAAAELDLHDFVAGRRDLEQLLATYPRSPFWLQAQEVLPDSFPREGLWLLDDQHQVDAGHQVLEAFVASSGSHRRAAEIELRLARLSREQHDLAGARARLEGVAARYPDSEAGGEALFTIAEIERMELNHLADAAKVYRRVIQEHASSTWAQKAGGVLTAMEEVELSASVPRVYTTAEGGARLALTTRNLASVELRAYSLDLGTLFARRKTVGRIENLLVDIVQPERVWTWEVPDYQDYRHFESDVPLEFKEPGAWIITVRGGALTSRVLAVTSDLSIVTKQSGRSVLVFATHEPGGRPAADVAVTVTRAGAELASGVTGADGVWRQQLGAGAAAAGRVDVLARAARGDFAFADSSGTQLGEWGYSAGGYLYTDRPVYRGGQQVYLRGILRDVMAGSYTESSNLPVEVTVTDRRGIVLHSAEFMTSELGTFAGGFTLPEEPSLGTAKVSARAFDRTFTSSFEIQEYRKPDFIVAVAGAQDAYRAGDHVGVTATVHTTYGAPLAAAPVEWQVFERAFTFDASRHRDLAWYFEPVTRGQGEPPGTLIAQGEGVTDAQGNFACGFDTDPTTGDHTYDVVVAAIDASHRQEFGEASILVTMQSYWAILEGDRQVYRAGETVRATLRTLDAAHRPVAASLGALVVLEKRQEPGRSVFEEVTRAPLVSNDSGVGGASWVAPAAGEFVLRYEGVDVGGHPVTAEVAVRVAGSTAEPDALRVLADREVYRAGDVANVLVESPASGVHALLTYEAEDLLDYRVVELGSSSTILEVPLGADCVPNVRVALGFARGSQLYSAFDEVLVFQTLDVTITVPAQAAPGEELWVDVSVTDQQGRPADAELSLGVVDESIYQIAPDLTPDIRATFYGKRRGASVSTAASASYRYQGTTTEVVAELLAESERRARVAKDKKSSSGNEPADFFGTPAEEPGRPLLEPPSAKDVRGRTENIFDAGVIGGGGGGSFGGRFGGKRQLVARGGGGKAAGGGDSASTPLRQHFEDTAFWSPAIRSGPTGKTRVRLSLPDNLTTWRLTARGVAAGTLVGSGRASLRVTKNLVARLDTPRFLVEQDTTILRALVRGAAGTDVQIVAEAIGLELTGLASTTVRVPASGEAALDLPAVATVAIVARARVQASSGAEGDAEERKFPVMERAVLERRVQSGMLGNTETCTLDRPAGFRPGSESVVLVLRSGVVDELLPALETLKRFPYGCTEQTVNRFLPALLIRNTWQRIAPERADALASIQEDVESGLVHLALLQREEDGAWGWWSGSSPDATMTALAVQALRAAATEGFRVQDETLARGVQAAAKMAATGSDEERAQLLYSLGSLPRENGFPQDAYLELLRRRESLPDTALALMASTASARGDSARARECVQILATRVSRASAAGSELEATGRALEAFLAVDPESPQIDTLARSLRVLMGRDSKSTRALAAVVPALAAYAERKAIGEVDGQVWVTIAKDRVASCSLKKAARRELLIPMAALDALGSHLELHFEGRGEIAYSLEHSWMAPLTPAASDAAPAGDTGPFTVERRLLDHGQGDASGQRGWSIVPASARPLAASLTRERLGVGDRAWVEVTLQCREEVRYVMVHVPLPAGVEVGDLEADVHGEGQSRLDRIERHDREVVLFYARLAPGTQRVLFPVRAYAPGRYTMLPTTAEAMYSPQQRARGAAGSLTVISEAVPVERLPDDVLAEARALMASGKLAEALEPVEWLLKTFRLEESAQVELMQMRLDIALDARDMSGAVSAFEALGGRGQLTRPQRAAVADAYLSVDQPERAMEVFRRLTEEAGDRELEVAAAYDAAGLQLEAARMREQTARSFPLSGSTPNTLLDLASVYRSLAGVAHPEEREADCQRVLAALLGRYPASALADDAAYQMLQSHLRIRDDSGAGRLATSFVARYPDSQFADDAQYTIAYAAFAATHFAEAAAAAEPLLARAYAGEDGKVGPSSYRDAARHLLAQAAHASGDLGAAVAGYREVADRIDDAALALAYLTETRLELPELGTSASVPLRYRNATTAAISVYRIDLLYYFALQKNLADVAKIELTGIPPTFTQDLDLPAGSDFSWHERTLELSLPAQGAYLVVAKSGETATAGLVLKSDLRIEVRRGRNRVRVHAYDTTTGAAAPAVHIKISAGGNFIGEGTTDSRGIFESPDASGPLSVLADRKGSPALYRE